MRLPLFGQGLVRFPRCRPGLGPAAAFISFASPKETKQRKGEPDASALRAHCVARAGREPRKLALRAQTARASRPTLRYSTPHDGGDTPSAIASLGAIRG